MLGLATLISRHARYRPGATAVVFGHERLDYAQFAAGVARAANLSLGAPLLQEHKDRLNADLPHRFYELYGCTEGFITILDRDEAQRKSGSVGRPTQYFEMRIVDADGYLYLVDRKKDMIDSGGMKVYPKDVEEVAARHPAIHEVAVFGVPHDKWGETPLAAVILREGAKATPEELRGWINERVAARYQRVSEVVIMEVFPRSTAGKTLKREMRDPYWVGRERKI